MSTPSKGKMETPNGEIQPKKRGRKSGDEVLQQVAFALKNVDHVDRLEDSHLARLPAVRQLAEGAYQESLYPAGFAVRVFLLKAVETVVKELSELPPYQQQIKFLREYAQGHKVAEISRRLGLSPEHVFRTVKPEALSLVTRAFLSMANRAQERSPVNTLGESRA